MQDKSDVLLTDLCALCHIHPIKYTCPRCGTHTCSLPCVKRHKSWAQCSGIRDPTAYRKRADLSTSASVDQDFNFITSVERSLQQADDLVSRKRIDLVPSGLRTDRRTKFDTAIEERGIRLIKAPKGLSRNKQNRSQWAGQQNVLMWTTEWIRYDGHKKLVNVTEKSTISEAAVMAFGKKIAHQKKRKRSNSETTLAGGAGRDHPPAPTNFDTQDNRDDTEIRTDSVTHREVVTDDRPSSQSGTLPDSAPAHGSVNVAHHEAAPSPVEDRYYLFKPNTTSKVKCLIPVAPDSRLMDILRNRTLLEFPTFYVRNEPLDELPAPFVTEEKYEELYGTDVSVNLPTYAPKDELEEGEVIDLDNIDEHKVLEVLQKDLAG